MSLTAELRDVKHIIYLQVEESGMEVLKKEEKVLSKEEAAEFYKQHEGSEHFDQLVEFMSRYGKIKTLLWDLTIPDTEILLLSYCEIKPVN